MKKYYNEKGSLPLAVMLAFILVGVVVSLSALYVTERTNVQLSLLTDVKEVYERDTVTEAVVNVALQTIKTKEYGDIDDVVFIDTNDLAIIEDIVNDDVLSDVGLTNYEVFLVQDYEPPTVDYFCVESEEVFAAIEYECMQEAFDLQWRVQIQQDDRVEEFVMEFNNLYPKVSPSGESVVIDSDDYEYSLRKN